MCICICICLCICMYIYVCVYLCLYTISKAFWRLHDSLWDDACFQNSAEPKLLTKSNCIVKNNQSFSTQASWLADLDVITYTIEYTIFNDNNSNSFLPMARSQVITDKSHAKLQKFCKLAQYVQTCINVSFVSLSAQQSDGFFFLIW